MTKFETLKAKKLVRFKVIADEHWDYDNLAGDTYNPEVNTDIPEFCLQGEKKEFKKRINREGVWGIVGEYWNGEEWQEADAVWGFVGDDWEDSGYDLDVKTSTVKAFENLSKCSTCGRPERNKS